MSTVCFKVDSIENGAVTFSVYNYPINSTLELTTTTAAGSSTSSVDMSCITDIIDDKLGNLSPVAASGSFNDLTDTPTNHVTTDTAQTITASKTFSQGPFGAMYALPAAAIDLSQGVVFTKTITANTTFTITNVPTGVAATFNLILTNGGSKTITWPSSVKWTDGTAPDLTASGVDVLTFLTPDGGTTWYGTVALTGAA